MEEPNSTQEMVNIQLPKALEDLPIAKSLCSSKQSWNSNEEIASILIAFEKHKDWKQLEIKIRPASGSMLLYSRNKVRYRKDGYCWKKRKDGKTIREDHMKLKVQGMECIYGSYVHSAVLPTFHRRCYWLLQNPDIVLVHYLNVPYTDNSKLTIPTLSYYMEKKEWTKEELVDQLRPMFFTGREPNQENKDSAEETIALIVKQLLDHQENHFVSKLHKCDALCDKNCALRGITPKRENSESGSEVNSRLISLLERNSHRTQTLNPQQISSNTTSIIMAPNSTQPVTTVTTLNDQGSATGTPLILNLSNFSGSNGIIILSGQTNTPISIINSTQTQEPPVTSNSSLGPADVPMAPQIATVSKPTRVHQGKDLPDISATCNVPMQISSSSEDLNSALLNSNKSNDLFSPSDFLSQSVLQNRFPGDLPTSQADLPVTNVDTSAIASSNCDMFKSDLSFPAPSDLSLDNLDLLDFADIDKLCPSWSDTCSDVGSDSIPQSSFNLIDKPMSILNCSSCHGNQTRPSHQMNSQQPLESNICQSSIPTHDVQTTQALSRLPLSDTQFSSLHPGTAAPLLYTQTHISPLLHETPSQLHCSHHLLSHQQQQQSSHLHDNGKPINLPNMHPNLNKGQLDKTQKETNVGHISDFSPDWSYIEGGTKVLVTGPWVTSFENYACVFDNKSIAATLVQPGVLRCFAPEHAPGLVTLHVTLDDCIISNCVVFEYKTNERREVTPTHGDWFSVDENQLQLMLLERLAQLEERLASNCITKDSPDQSQTDKPSDREGQLIRFCQLLSQRQWLSVESLPKLTAYGTRLLHLSAGLGYHKLIQQLINWRSADTSAILDSEIDAHSLDNFSSTPLMWACARGHLQSALCLYNWSSSPIKLCNKDGLFPLDVARRNGHHTLADQLEILEQDTVMLMDPNQFSLGSPIADLNSFLLDSPIKGSNSIPSFKPVIPSDNPDPLLNYCPEPERETDPSALTSLHIDIPAQTQYQTNAQAKLTRRFSEQTCASVLRRRLNKRFSMEVFPDSTLTNYCSNQTQQSLRIANSEPDLGANIEGLSRGDNPMISEHCHGSPEDLLFQAESLLGIHRLQNDDVFSISRAFHPITSQHSSTNNQVIAMDTDEISSVRSESPFIDVEKVSSDDDELHNLVQQAANLAESSGAEGQHQMVTLANQIIAAMPERIKSSPSRCDEGVVTECQRGRSESHSSLASQNSPPPSSYGDDSGISTPLGEGLSFDDFRYRDIDTPASSLSPDSTCLPSPYSPYTFQLDSPPPTTAEFNEYFNAPTTYMEKDFSQLTLSDHEQRKLYEAAKLIQNAFRIYRDKQQQQQQLQKEIEAAILIQSYYRRYKQYMYYKKMTQAAVLIQSQFRSYSAQKRYKKSRDAAVVIQNQYRTYKQHERFKKSRNAAVIIQQRFRNHYQRKQSQEMASNLLQMASESNDNSPVHDANTTISDATTSVDTKPKKTTTKSGDTAKKKAPLLKRSSSVGKSKLSLELDPDLDRHMVNANKQKSSKCMGDNSDSTTPVRRASSLSKT